ncbi:hypothetical protein SUGI_0176930 [Cryptomeria japonica]|uniref:uncharacterized protein LOC131052154 n=1 Tax=Cryptomeria japonica TaxID=3369 RepID=UPI002408C423|nr:uncharacterized protein LOC131052154 [Cryptomeria japonica]XP_057842736.2 uncharacterized protein LOC131052154 [Cryptomeria japonica]XP_057842737.2 uncharacterized protein LOC131052154 [Cryptomeria japonica]XP_057842738.2 uncharacterized protein LOC131052154 [Cryptomeria japonica]XP_059072684.1 uncharacterized protein LOC131052154 [Cryptomeria japonica]GLJ11782.1 hypothetical protein SUGI_0176930 [Cryptomeria japonica]
MMDPRAFVRVSVGALGLRIPVASKAVRAGVHALSSPCFCEVRLTGLPTQTTSVPLITSSSTPGSQDLHSIAATFYLEESELKKLIAPRRFKSSLAYLEIVIFTGRQGSHCGVSSSKQIGTFRLQVGAEWAEGKTLLLHNGWTNIGKNKVEGSSPRAELHVRVKVEPDPRYIFQFEDETALSPQIVQLQGSVRQPIFSCKFSRDRGTRARASQLDGTANGWSGSHNSDKDSERRDRKGWLVMIHDLSGSAVAAASMVTPFVPSTGSDRVSRSNPGAWLILRPDSSGVDSWQPWGRLEAWRERGGKDFIGCRFQLVEEGGGLGVSSGIVISETLISADKGGEFLIDTSKVTPSISPILSPHSSGDFTFNFGLQILGGFVMTCRVQGEGKSSKPLVQLAMRHITCVEDAAIFMALTAAVDLSIEACKPFTKKLRKAIRD